MKVIKTDEMRVPIKSWCMNPEQGAIDQAMNLARLPFIFKHVALMPDTHLGYGMPIGGVIACKDVVIPNAVGVDIGCGMYAVRTNLKREQISTYELKLIMGRIQLTVPVGFKHQIDNRNEDHMPIITEEHPVLVVESQFDSAIRQLGTLGGGNHFIEIQYDEEGYVWFMIHSGSRNLGKQVADFYNKMAKDMNEEWYSSVPKEWDLAYYPLTNDEAENYLNEMNYCLEFARVNRELIAFQIMDAFRLSYPMVAFNFPINIHHNYVSLENHFGQNVWVHRKGATLARVGTIGIIPGSQGTSSYIVEGLGNPDSFMSCSHGAGRKMGRNEAKKTLVLADEIKRLDDQGIVHGITSVNELDEAAGSYKDIDIVMEEQKDLVKILHKLTPMGVIKG